ncbi:ABC transporter permease [Chitinophaga defluvii]|uniref:ABC transporter permease subunit n=1 Tax=Chitinophaga defluvii TaxID=3163343 RepID=A0ABV2T0H1_9BACT
MFKIAKYVLQDIFKNKVIIGYTLFLLIVTSSLFLLDNDVNKGISSLMSIVLIIVPLISMVFATTYFYNAYEFIELLVAQPVSRGHIILGIYLGMGIAMIGALVIGVAVPLLCFAPSVVSVVLILAVMALTLIFVSLAFLSAVITRDKAKGVGVALLIWFYFAILYDGLVLSVLFSFSEYPLEKVMLACAVFNPVDLGRITILLKLDIAALMGYTGAVYKQFLGNNTGVMVACGLMLLWIIWPLWLSVKLFRKKNL